MKKMKRVLVVALALCFAMSLAGCAPRPGKYYLASLTINGQDYLAMLQAFGQSLEDVGYLEIIDGKNAKIVTADEENELTYDKNYFYFAADGSKAEYSFNAITRTFTISYKENGQDVKMTYKK